MHITGKTRRELLVQNVIYYALLIAIAATVSWLSVRYTFQSDWSANNRNTLNQVSRDIAQKIDGAIQVTAFVPEDETTRSAIRDLIARYQRYKSDIELEFVNPQTSPSRTRELNISSMGELIIQHGESQERLQQLNEKTFTNALQRIVRGKQHWIVFLAGHGELDPYEQSHSGLSKFTSRATQEGFQVQGINLLAEQKIPDNTHVLVIASPQKDYLPGEVNIVLEYLRQGGNLLWLTEPENDAGLELLAKELGLARLPGVVVDATGQLYGVTQPDFVFVVNYPDKQIMQNFNEFTLFPQAVALIITKNNPLNLTSSISLQTLARSWTETGPIEGEIEFSDDGSEVAGPLNIGISLSRNLNTSNNETNIENDKLSLTQRIVTIGDGDFLTNGYIGNGSNMQLGINIFNWLSHDDDLIHIDAVSAPDTQLNASSLYITIIGFSFLIFIPLGLVIAGVVIWLKRRKR